MKKRRFVRNEEKDFITFQELISRMSNLQLNRCLLELEKEIRLSETAIIEGFEVRE